MIKSIKLGQANYKILPQDPNLPSLLIAFGGNALNVKENPFTHQKEEFIVARKSIHQVVDLMEQGYGKIILTHGNGPQIGKIFLQQELTKNDFPRQVSLDVCVADSQGRIGYILQNVFDNICIERKIKKKASTVITQVVVDKNDPAFQNPTKPIGVFYKPEEAQDLIQTRGWVMKEDAGRGWRRVVASPKPLEIIEKTKFLELLKWGFIAIGAGGGGIPVVRKSNGELRGIEAVIDKDLTSALLARMANIDVFIILTEVSHAYLHYNSPNQKILKEVPYSEMKKYYEENHFHEGSMKPKIEAALNFIKYGGRRAIIAHLFELSQAVRGEVGTHIIPDDL